MFSLHNPHALTCIVDMIEYTYILPVVPTRRPVNGNALSHFISMYKSILPRRAWKYTQFSKREGKNHHAKIPDAFLFPLEEGAVVTIVKTTIKAFNCFHLQLYYQYSMQFYTNQYLKFTWTESFFHMQTSGYDCSPKQWMEIN